MQNGTSVGLVAPPYFNFATDIVDAWARQRPEAMALWHVTCPSGREQKYTFAQISEFSLRAAQVLHVCGIKRGDRVLVMLPRMPQWWFATLALIRIGAVPVPATLLLTARDVAYRLQTARISAVITSADGVAKVDGFDGLKFLVGGSANGWIDFDENLHRTAALFRGEPTRSNDPGSLFFTSATTGELKMVLHSQASYGLGHRLTGELWLDLKPEDLHWNISDLGWGKAAWSSFYGPWHMGACVFALDVPGKFDAGLTLSVLEEFPITTWCAPPTALRLIVRQDLSKRNFSTLRHCVTAGEPLNPEVLNLWKQATGLTLHEGYGQTETVILIANFASLHQPVRPGSMGKPTPGFQLALVDEHLRELPPGHEGEVAIRVEPHRPLGLFQEYWLNPHETSHAFQAGWYLTGDRATCDAEGYYWFIGRKDDVIKSSGYRIGPFEVESALLEHAAVLDVAVVGQPDPLRGQIVKAFIVLRESAQAREELKAELQTHCKNLVAAYKYPREIEFVAELPKTTSGKTRRVALRQAVCAGETMIAGT
jgi:acetyl-CoA synthetase/medium-chain acyl-CoA synthetase